MKAFTWILIGISIIFLLCLPCLQQPTFENMDNAGAAPIANSYVNDLTNRRRRAIQNGIEAQDDVNYTDGRFPYTDGRLINANKLLDATKLTTKPEDRTRLIGEVQNSIAAELTKCQKIIDEETVNLTNAKAELNTVTKPEDREPLIESVETITAKLDKYQKRLADANVMKTAATELLTAKLTEVDRTKQIDNVQSINWELDKHKRAVLHYTNEEARFDALIIDAQKFADYVKKQADDEKAAPDQSTVPPTPTDPPPPNSKTSDLDFTPSYYEPGTYKFGSVTYVPSYEDSVYLSRTTGKSSTTRYLDAATMKGGACSYYKDQPEKLEEMCLAVDKNKCGAMSCCVLLGGSKCVSGDALGPRNKLNYGDITLRDKDYYFHDGKCYGNCKP